MNTRTLMMGLIILYADAGVPHALASDRVDRQDTLCYSIATPASGPIIAAFQQTMHEAIERRDWRDIRFLIWDGADPNWTRNTKWHKRAVQETLNRNLVHASAIGDEQRLIRLIRAGADVNVKPDYDDNMSPLIWAARCGQASTVRLSLDKGADVNITAGYGHGSMGYVEGSTALMWAASYGNLGVIKVLLEGGANPNVQVKVTLDISKPTEEENGGTALSQAADNEAADLLLRAKADPNLVGVNGISPLMNAATYGDLDRCKLLLAWGANPRLKDKDGRTAANLAEQAKRIIVAKLLKDLE